MTDRNSNEGSGTTCSLVTSIQDAATKIIVVNGREHRFEGDEIGHDELARMAFPAMNEAGGITLTVAYDHGPLEAPRGLLGSGRTARVLEGQKFSVSCTDKS